MPSPSPILALPGEIRNEIWRHLLCPYGTVDLQVDFDWYCEIRDAESQNFENDEEGEGEDMVDKEDDEEDEDEDMDEDEYDRVTYEERLNSARAVRAKHALTVSILRVNQQLYSECFSFLYSNRFIFHMGPSVAVLFLSHLSARDHAYIRHIGFGPMGICANIIEKEPSWKEMFDYLATESKIEIVTIWVPQKEEAGDDQWYYWSGVRGLVRMLLDGNIESVRLLFANILSVPNEEDFAGTTLEPITLPKDEVLEELVAVDEALYRRMGTEEQAAILTYLNQHQGIDSKARAEFRRRDKEKRRLPLKFEREDGVGGIAGSVVVLKRES